MSCRIGKKKKALFIAVSVSLSTLAALLLGEIGLRLGHSALPDYDDTWTSPPVLGRGGFLKPNFDGLVTNGLGRQVRWHNNGDGFRNDRDFGPFPSASTLRIISMGDSFTAGYRVAQEETFSFLLEKWITRREIPTEVMVSCVEEPSTGLSWLQRFGVDFHPDMVLLGLTLGNDIAQSYIALNPTPIGFQHGLETCLIPNRCFSRSPSLWENFEAKFTASSLSRLLLAQVFRHVTHPPEIESPQGIVSWYGVKSPAAVYLFDALIAVV